VVEGEDDDAGAEADVLGAGGDGGQGDGGGGAVAVLAEVVLGRPHGVVAELLGAQHDVELLVDDLLLAPPHRVLEQVKLTEPHRAYLLPRDARPAVAPF
jgi:hypothetical protein